MNSSGRSDRELQLIAIDAGGSKTRALLCRREGSGPLRVEGDLLFGPGNFTVEGVERVAAMLAEVRRGFPQLDPQHCRVVAGFAGASSKESWEILQTLFESAGFALPQVKIMSDGHLLLEALGGDGIGLILGTGAFCLGRCSGTEARSGGRGWVIGSDGSGFWYGQQAVRAAFFDCDGLGPKTALRQLVEQHFQVTDLARVVTIVHRPPFDKARLAQLAPVVFQAARAGDAEALRIVQLGAESAGRLLAVVHERLGRARLPVALSGGIVADRSFQDLVLPHLLEHAGEGRSNLTIRLFTQTGPENDVLYLALARAAECSAPSDSA